MIKSLTSLRFFFAFMVLLNHVPYSFNHPFYSIISNGSVGVSFFFILSGFILAYNYEDRFLIKYDKRKFWIDRFLRIYPLHVFILLLFVIHMLIVTTDWGLLPEQFLAHLFLIQNYIPIKNIYSSLNKPAWSICCELFFYFTFPFIILRVKKWWKLTLLGLIIFPFVLYYINPNNSIFIGINPLIRFSDFVAGIFAYQIYKRLKKINLSMNVLKYSVLELIIFLFLFISLLSFQGLKYYQFFPIYWFPMIVFILTMAFSKGYISIILGNKYLVLLGEISYSIYMTHFLIMQLLATYFRDTFIFSNRFLLIFMFASISIIFSYFTHKLIEIKFSRFLKPYIYNYLKSKDKTDV